MSFKDKILKLVISHPKLVTFGIGLAITFAVGTVWGLTSPEQAFAISFNNQQ